MDVNSRFFLILSDNGTNVDIDVLTVFSSTYTPIKGVGAGFGLESLDEDPIKNLRITSSVSQTLKIYMGGVKATYNRLGGTVSVSGTVNTKETGSALTNTYKAAASNLLAANGVDTIFTPAANVNGAIIQSLEFISGNATSSQLGGYYVRATAPTAANDSGAILSFRGFATFGSSNRFFGSKDTPITIGAGLGLYFFSSFLEDYQIRSASWTFL